MYCPARRPLAQLPLPLILYCLALLRTALRAVWRVAVSAAEKRDYEAVFLACQVGVCRAGLKPKPSNRHLGLLPHHRSEEHTSELQSLMRISYAVFCLKKKKKKI